MKNCNEGEGITVLFQNGDSNDSYELGRRETGVGGISIEVFQGLLVFFFFFFKYLFIWLHRIVVITRGIFDLH